MRSEEQILDELLRDRGRAPTESSILRALGGDLLHLVPVDAVMLVEAAVLGRDDRMSEQW